MSFEKWSPLVEASRRSLMELKTCVYLTQEPLA